MGLISKLPTVPHAIQHLAARADHCLTLGWRLRIWLDFKRIFREDAQWRRGVLAWLVACGTLDAWNQATIPAEFSQLPANLLGLCKDLLLEQVPATEAEDRRMQAISSVDRVLGLVDQHGFVVGAAGAAYAALECALGHDEQQYSETDVGSDGDTSLYEKCTAPGGKEAVSDELFDWPGWDAHYFASLVAGSRGPLLDGVLLNRFWKQWLSEYLPLVYPPRVFVIARLSRNS